MLSQLISSKVAGLPNVLPQGGGQRNPALPPQALPGASGTPIGAAVAGASGVPSMGAGTPLGNAIQSAMARVPATGAPPAAVSGPATSVPPINAGPAITPPMQMPPQTADHIAQALHGGGGGNFDHTGFRDARQDAMGQFRDDRQAWVTGGRVGDRPDRPDIQALRQSFMGAAPAFAANGNTGIVPPPSLTPVYGGAGHFNPTGFSAQLKGQRQ